MNENIVTCRLVARQRPRNKQIYNIRCSVAASNGVCSPASGFPNYPRTSTTSFSQQIAPAVLSLTHSLTNQLNSTQLTLTNCPAYNISVQPQRKHRSSVAVPLLRSCLLGFTLLLYPIIVVEICFLAEPLLSNGCCVIAYSAVVA
jgi:hypothetical protein